MRVRCYVFRLHCWTLENLLASISPTWHHIGIAFALIITPLFTWAKKKSISDRLQHDYVVGFTDFMASTSPSYASSQACLTSSFHMPIGKPSSIVFNKQNRTTCNNFLKKLQKRYSYFSCIDFVSYFSQSRHRSLYAHLIMLVHDAR